MTKEQIEELVRKENEEIDLLIKQINQELSFRRGRLAMLQDLLKNFVDDKEEHEKSGS